MSDRQTLKDINPTGEDTGSNNGEPPKRYYYDDATGYETYDAESDADEEGADEGD
jgi:hypothetical protein